MLITTKPTKGRRKNTSEDNKEMKKTKLKGECYKSKTAFSMWYTNADTLHNKLPELRNRIKHAKSPPSIIALMKSSPKTPVTHSQNRKWNWRLWSIHQKYWAVNGSRISIVCQARTKGLWSHPRSHIWRNVGRCSSPVQQSEHASLLHVQEPLINNGK